MLQLLSERFMVVSTCPGMCCETWIMHEPSASTCSMPMKELQQLRWLFYVRVWTGYELATFILEQIITRQCHCAIILYISSFQEFIEALWHRSSIIVWKWNKLWKGRFPTCLFSSIPGHKVVLDVRNGDVAVGTSFLIYSPNFTKFGTRVFQHRDPNPTICFQAP